MLVKHFKLILMFLPYKKVEIHHFDDDDVVVFDDDDADDDYNNNDDENMVEICKKKFEKEVSHKTMTQSTHVPFKEESKSRFCFEGT